MTVIQEDATAVYTGGTLFWASSSTGSTATATLSATITAEKADGTPGNITNATVDFVDVTNAPNTAVVCQNVPVGLVSNSDTTVGTATCNHAFNIGSSNGSSYDVEVVVKNYFTN
jgi:hypothetical protein